MKIYHNPRCRKSRETLEILENAQIKHEVVLYLEEMLSKSELKDILKKLGIPAEQLIRRGESIFKEKFKSRKLTEDQWLDAMITYPKLMERPIVVRDSKAVIGRPPENVKLLL